MFTTKTFRKIATALFGAIVIGLSSGTAQASVADTHLIVPDTAQIEPVSSQKDLLREMYRQKVRDDRRKEWERHHYHDRDRYGPPPPPPRHDDRGRYGPPPRR